MVTNFLVRWPLTIANMWSPPLILFCFPLSQFSQEYGYSLKDIFCWPGSALQMSFQWKRYHWSLFKPYICGISPALAVTILLWHALRTLENRWGSTICFSAWSFGKDFPQDDLASFICTDTTAYPNLFVAVAFLLGPLAYTFYLFHISPFYHICFQICVQSSEAVIKSS